MNKSPCKNCPDRSITCHSGCPKYQQYSSERELIYKERKQRIELLYGVNDIKERSIKKNTGVSSAFLKSRNK